MIAMQDCIEAVWAENRSSVLFFVAGEKRLGVWRFYERRTWEVCWYMMKSTSELVLKAEQLAELGITREAA